MYLRNALPKMRESVSTVAQEVELVRSYLNILKMRMGDRLAFTIEVPAELENAPFPPLMLPTLAENAIKHGLEPLREGGTVTIKAELVEGMLRLSVADTGKGFGDSVSGSGVGLENIRERLAAIYGDKAKLTLEENQPRGVVASIEVPRDGLRVGGNAMDGDSMLPEKPPQPEPPKTPAAKAFAAFKTGEYRQALRLANHAAVDAPRDPRVHEAMSLALFAINDYRGAARPGRRQARPPGARGPRWLNQAFGGP